MSKRVEIDWSGLCESVQRIESDWEEKELREVGCQLVSPIWVTQQFFRRIFRSARKFSFMIFSRGYEKRQVRQLWIPPTMLMRSGGNDLMCFIRGTSLVLSIRIKEKQVVWRDRNHSSFLYFQKRSSSIFSLWRHQIRRIIIFEIVFETLLYQTKKRTRFRDAILALAMKF